MRSGIVPAAVAVSIALLTGCGSKKPTQVVSPVAAQAPELSPLLMASSLPPVPPAFPPVTTHPVKLDATTPAPEVKTEVATRQPQKPPKRHNKTAPAQEETVRATVPAPAAATPAQITQVATAQPAEATPLGQLTTSDTSNTADRQALSGDIDSTETGLNSIKRPLDTDEQKTATLIRQYITRARDALKNDDLTGATNLSTKAKQLLQELTKP
jgi:outer membrane biosynthesis protein TonB